MLLYVGSITVEGCIIALCRGGVKYRARSSLIKLLPHVCVCVNVALVMVYHSGVE